MTKIFALVDRRCLGMINPSTLKENPNKSGAVMLACTNKNSRLILKSFLFIAMVFSLVITGCGGGQQSVTTEPDNYFKSAIEQGKEWPLTPPTYTDAYSGIGVSAPGLSASMARTQAENRGRAAVAKILGTRINLMVKDWLDGSYINTGQDAISQESQLTQEVSRSLVDQEVSGAFVKDTWVSPKGEFWILMVLPKESFLNTARSSLLQEAEQLRAVAENKMNDAMEEMDNILEKEKSAPVTAGSSQ